MEWTIRHITNTDWVIFIEILVFVKLALIRYYFPKYFDLLVQLPIKNNFLLQLFKSQVILSSILILFISIPSMSLFIWMGLNSYLEENMKLAYFDIFLIIALFLSAKTIARWIIFNILDLKDQLKIINISRSNYFYYGSLILFFSILLFSSELKMPLPVLIVATSLFILIIFYGLIQSSILNRRVINKNLFYYILYLCVLDISPLILMYNFFIK